MDIIVESPGFKASQDHVNYVHEKVGKLKPNDRIIRANVTLFAGPDKATPTAYCEIRLEIPGNDLFVKSDGGEFEQAVDNAVATIQEQLRRAKEKQEDSYRRIQ